MEYARNVNCFQASVRRDPEKQGVIFELIKEFT